MYGGRTRPKKNKGLLEFFLKKITFYWLCMSNWPETENDDFTFAFILTSYQNVPVSAK